jgi:hypothetical protein
MRCQWHRMHVECGVIDRMHSVCEVIDTARTVHAGSFMHVACGGIDTASIIQYETACTMDEIFVRPWQPLKGISIKTFMYVNCPNPPLQNDINLRGLTNKTISCMWCHLRRMHENQRLKSRISSRIKSRIPKDFRPSIRGPSGISRFATNLFRQVYCLPIPLALVITQIFFCGPTLHMRSLENARM